MKIKVFVSKSTYFENTQLVTMFKIGGNPYLLIPYIITNEILIYKR